MNIKKIDSVTMPVRDVKRSAGWYAETLGLEEIWRQDENKGVGFGVGDNSATLNLFEETGGMRLIIQVDRVDDARAELERKGVKADERSRAARIHDRAWRGLSEHIREAATLVASS